MSFRHQRPEKWVDCLFSELYREVNSDYEMLCVSTEFTCKWLEDIANLDRHCTSFSSRSLPLSANVYERLDKLEMLGCDDVEKSIVIPVVNADSDNAMTAAVYEILEEQGIFEDVSPEGITWSDCPLVTLEINPFDADDIPYDAPAVIALCSGEDDYIKAAGEIPIYALVMGTETKFIKRSGTKLFFSVDPDDIGMLFLQIIEEEALCPVVSRLSYEFPAQAKDFLTESEKEDLELVCQGSPLCRVTIPQMCDVGRAVKPNAQILPLDSETQIRIISDLPDVIEIEDGMLLPRSEGTAEVSVFIGDDPYPVAAEQVNVRKRNLISAINLFPSMLCIPVGGKSELTLTTTPDDAENRDEIRWSCDDSSVASVDFNTGVISAKACGRCSVTASTAETSKSVCVEVLPNIEDIICPCSFLELTAGEQKKWKYQVVPENAYGVDFLQIISSDKNVAEYRGGYVLGKSAGCCKIYVKDQSGSISRELTVSVKKSKKFW
ncbi:MAG: Ig-like domain-containing protein [Clostridia bacterium]|nr:Ig-like domain-containing protein [Clostridia bacterium]